ncbi:MAG: OmpA family protein [Acidobacteria bacterium]|nr:OmpA family protein [Acidobacteriota bacterium]
MFDSIIKDAQEKFGLGDKAGSLVSSLLGIIANPANGGFAGFINRFRDAGLGEQADSWISSGDNTPITDDQVEAAFGNETIDSIVEQSGVERASAVSALGSMTPQVVDALTPDGEVPDDASLLSKVKGFLSEFGGAAGAAVLGALSATGAFAGAAADKIGDAAGATVDAGKAVVGKGAEVVGDAAGAVGDAAGATYDAGKKAVGAVGDSVGGAIGKVGNVLDGDGNCGGVLRWLLPLLILVGLLVLGYWFCGKSTPTTTSNVNSAKSNVNGSMPAKQVESSFSISARDGKYAVTGVVPDQKTFDEIKTKLEAQFGAGNVDFSGLKVDANAKPFAAGWWDNFGKLLPSLKDWKNGTLSFAGNAITAATGLPAAALDQLKTLFAGWTMPGIGDAERKLTEVALPNGTKLQAYPGGIEDQLIKFIQSDDFKNGTDESLKNKWFSFDDLNFKFGTTELAPESKRQLDNIVAILKAFPSVKIKIGGYTYKKGDDAANKKLSDDRAKAVKAALDKAGVGAQVPEAEGYGEQFATVAETAGDEERKADRKTAIRLLK